MTTPGVRCLRGSSTFTASILERVSRNTGVAGPFFRTRGAVDRTLPAERRLRRTFLSSRFRNTTTRATVVTRRYGIRVGFRVPVLPGFPAPGRRDTTSCLGRLYLTNLGGHPLTTNCSPASCRGHLRHRLAAVRRVNFSSCFLVI